MTQSDQEEPFFITEEIAAEMIAAGYEFEPPPIPCTIRLRDVLARMTDDELAELRQDMAEASAWMRAELARRRTEKGQS